MYLMRLALRPWRDAPLSQIFSSIAVGFLLVMIGLVVWMQRGLNPVIARLKGEQVITAYLDPSVDSKSETKVVDSIRLVLGAHAVSDIQVVQPEQFVKNLKPQYPELSRELEDLGPEMMTLVPRFVSVSGILPSGALDSVKSVPGVESAESSKDRYRTILAAFGTLRTMLVLLAAGLMLALLTGLMHLSRMNAHLQEDAISILKLFGAPSWAVRSPTVLSGLVVGAVGGGFAMVGWMTLGLGLARHVRELSTMLQDMPSAPVTGGFALFAGAVTLGFAAGALGAVFGGSKKGRA